MTVFVQGGLEVLLGLELELLESGVDRVVYRIRGGADDGQG